MSPREQSFGQAAIIGGRPHRNLTVMVAGLGLAAVAAGTARSETAAAQDPAPAVRSLIGDNVVALSDGSAIVQLGDVGDTSKDGAFGWLGEPLTCLTMAVYYEARSESSAGQEAVAQVVMNRVRRTGFGGSVCAVVFARLSETSGCQFSFVCDGSMNRPIEQRAWAKAQSIAERALAGHVFKPAVHALHFHASYVSPYWRSSLVRIGQIGTHIFYR
jgi:hypothetical protein